MDLVQYVLATGNAALLLAQVLFAVRGRTRRVLFRFALASLAVLHAAQVLLWYIKRRRFARLNGVYRGRVSDVGVTVEYPVEQVLGTGRYVSRLRDSRLCVVTTTPVDQYAEAARAVRGGALASAAPPRTRGGAAHCVEEVRDDRVVATVVVGVPLESLAVPDLNIAQMVSAAQQLCRFLTDRQPVTRGSVCVASFTPLALLNRAAGRDGSPQRRLPSIPTDPPAPEDRENGGEDTKDPHVDVASTHAAGACLMLLYTGADDTANLALLQRMAPQPLAQLARDMLAPAPPAPEALAQHLQVFTTVFETVL